MPISVNCCIDLWRATLNIALSKIDTMREKGVRVFELIYNVGAGGKGIQRGGRV